MAISPKPAKQPKWTGEQALAAALKDTYVTPEQITRAASLAPPGALLAAAVSRLLDPATKVVSRALVAVLESLPWSAGQADAIEQAWRTMPDHSRPKAVRILQLLLGTGTARALAFAHELTRSEARCLVASSGRWDMYFASRDRPRWGRVREILRVCEKIANQETQPFALPAAPAGQFRYYSVSIQLLNSAYTASRRFLIAHDADWDDLHDAIQRASDAWDNSHLWAFLQGKGSTQIATNADDDDGLATCDSRIAELVEAGQRTFNYIYDFGDHWRVSVAIAAKPVCLPEDYSRILLAGQGAFPPEDCGGAGGHYRLTLAARARTAAASEPGYVQPEADEDNDWGGGYDRWDPDAFDFATVKAVFDRRRATTARHQA